jgi:hypothetical protein
MSRRSKLTIVAVLLALAGVVASVAINIIASIIYNPSSYTRSVNKLVALSLSVLAAFVAAASAYWVWKREEVDEVEEPDEPRLKMRQRLINRVLEFAQAQFDSGLYEKARKEFQLADRRLRVTTAADRILDVRVEPYYRSLQGPLIILGQPGTGKTTLLYELVTLLVPRDEHGPIAVPFGLSNWALKGGPLEEWLAADLKRNYGVSPSLAKSWVANDVVLPLLDGLDEVPGPKRADCVNRINEYLAAHPEIKPVITCREAEYGELKLGIEATSALVVRTMERADVEAFLGINPGEFVGLRSALDRDPGLWELMNTPLMLWIAAFAFEGAGDSLANSGVGQTRERLFARYVDRMLKRERGASISGRGKIFSVSDAKFWLHRTAACMERSGLFGFHLEDVSFNWLPPEYRPTDGTIRIVYGLVGGVFQGLVLTLVGGPFVGLVGFVGGALIIWQKKTFPTPVDTITLSISKVKENLIRGLAAGIFAGLIVGLFLKMAWTWGADKKLIGLFQSLGGGLEGALVAGGALGGVTGLAYGLYSASEEGLVASSVQRRASVNDGLRQSAVYTGILVFSILILTVVLKPLARRYELLGAVAAYVLLTQAVVVVWDRGGGFCVHNLTLRCLLAVKNYIPWRYEEFLYFATNHVLMMRQGGSFRFSHRILQEYLAAHPPL